MLGLKRPESSCAIPDNLACIVTFLQQLGIRDWGLGTGDWERSDLVRGLEMVRVWL